MKFYDLTDSVRQCMLAELEEDMRNEALYLSPRLNGFGIRGYPDIIKHALSEGSPESFAVDIRSRGCLKSHEERRKRGGGYTLAKVPVNAAETLAEGEFNRFFLRGLCCYVLKKGKEYVEVYRAKEVRDPRSLSEELIGKKLLAKEILQDLRTHQGVDTALGLPAGPNSGLSARLPKEE